MRIFVLFKEGTDQVIMPGSTIVRKVDGESYTLLYGKAPNIAGNTDGAVVVRDWVSGEEVTMSPGVFGLEYRKV